MSPEDTSKMQELLRWCDSLLTILPRTVIAARVRPSWTGWAFVALTAGALTWVAVASFAQDYALLAQNIAITIINCRHLSVADPERKCVIGIIGPRDNTPRGETLKRKRRAPRQ